MVALVGKLWMMMRVVNMDLNGHERLFISFTKNHGEILGFGTDWTGYTRTQMLEFINSIVAPYNNGNDLSVVHQIRGYI